VAIVASAALFAIYGAAPADAQSTGQVSQSATSSDRLLTLVLSSANPSDVAAVG
jgi:hypothetical protein